MASPDQQHAPSSEQEDRCGYCDISRMNHSVSQPDHEFVAPSTGATAGGEMPESEFYDWYTESRISEGRWPVQIAKAAWQEARSRFMQTPEQCAEVAQLRSDLAKRNARVARLTNQHGKLKLECDEYKRMAARFPDRDEKAMDIIHRAAELLLVDVELQEARSAVIEAARRLRGIVGNSNQHSATCQNSPCDVCEDVGELEGQAGLDLDIAIAALGQIPVRPPQENIATRIDKAKQAREAGRILRAGHP